MKTSLLILLTLFLSFGGNAQSWQCPDTNSVSCSSIRDSVINTNTVNLSKKDFHALFPNDRPSMHFGKDELIRMNKMNPDGYVRLYFILTDNRSEPKLLFVNVNSACEDQEDSVLISADPKGRSSIGTLTDSIRLSLARFQNSYTDSTFEKIYAYNYKWKTIWQACTPTNHKKNKVDTLNLTVKIGVIKCDRTKKSHYDLFLTFPYNEKEDRDGKYTKQYINFSRPCPKLCGALGPREEETEIPK